MKVIISALHLFRDVGTNYFLHGLSASRLVFVVVCIGWLIEAMMKIHQYRMMRFILAKRPLLKLCVTVRKMLPDGDSTQLRSVVRRFNEMGLKCHLPRGSFYAFPAVSQSTGLDEVEFCHRLLESEAAVPGTAFGPHKGHVREFLQYLRKAGRGNQLDGTIYRPSSCRIRTFRQG